MPWRIFVTGRMNENFDGAVEFSCIVTQTEDEARGCALRLYREGARRVIVRPPVRGQLLAGPMLHNWLIGRQRYKLTR